MKSIIRFCLGLLTASILSTSCGSNEGEGSQNSQEQGTVEHGSFKSFLQLFEETKSFGSWDEKVVDVLGGVGGVYDPEEIQNRTLRKNFSEIGPEFHHFIPTSSIINLDPEYSDDIPDPLTAYQFWAAYKSEIDGYWLVSVFALKREWVKEEGHSEFNAHPVLLITFSESGKPLDHYLWTYLIDDSEQIYEDVSVSGDTLITGYSPMFGTDIEKVYSQTIIGRKGKFLNVYKAAEEEPDLEDEI